MKNSTNKCFCSEGAAWTLFISKWKNTITFFFFFQLNVFFFVLTLFFLNFLIISQVSHDHLYFLNFFWRISGLCTWEMTYILHILTDILSVSFCPFSPHLYIHQPPVLLTCPVFLLRLYYLYPILDPDLKYDYIWEFIREMPCSVPHKGNNTQYPKLTVKCTLFIKYCKPSDFKSAFGSFINKVFNIFPKSSHSDSFFFFFLERLLILQSLILWSFLASPLLPLHTR